VQRNAMRAWRERADFLDLLLADADIRASLSEDVLRDLFDLEYHLKHVDMIFDRVFGQGA
jgi:adenylosuccinate lyase